MNDFYKNFKFNYLLSVLVHIFFMFIFVKKDTQKIINPIQITDIQFFYAKENVKKEEIKTIKEIKKIAEDKIEKNDKKTKTLNKEINAKVNDKPNKNQEKINAKENIKKEEQLTNKNIQLEEDDDDEILTLSAKLPTNKNKNIKSINNQIKFEKNFPFDYYIRLIIKKVNETWLCPFVPSNAKCIVYFKIDRKGKISDIKIYEKSKYKEFDESAITSINKIKSFPELPIGYKEEFLGVFFSFEFA